MIKVVSWNVNGIRACVKKGFFTYLETYSPDILVLQETKVDPSILDDAIANPSGYTSAWNGAIKRGYSGTALLTKPSPISVIHGIGIPEFDCEARVVTAVYDTFTLLGVYFPNGQKDETRLFYKLAFHEALLDYCTDLRKQNHALIIAGDYNIAHTPIDLARPEENAGISGFLPSERAWLDKLTAAGYIDSFRVFNQNPEQYTWWSYRSASRRRNIGWRIDYLFISSDLLPRLKDAFIHQDVLGSDHCPVGIQLD